MSPDEIQDSFARIQKAELIGNYAYAETLCAGILSAKPDEHRARLLLRRSQIARFRQKHRGNNPISKFKLGAGSIFSAKSSDDPLRDVLVAEETLTQNPYDVAANQLLLRAAERLDWGEIEQLCLDTIAEGTPTPENLIGKAKGLIKRGQFQPAIRVLDQAREKFPDNLELDKAHRDAQAEAATNSGWTQATRFTELLVPGQERGNEAQRLTEAIEANPGNLSLIDQLIVHLEYAGDTLLLLEWIAYRRGLEEHPGLRRKVFDIERRQGSLTLEHELDELRHFVKEYPGDPDLHLALGGALMRNGDAEAAILAFQAARRHGKTVVRVEAMTALAQAYDAVGLHELGERSRTQALQLAGDDEVLKKEILYQMAQSLETNEKKKEARVRWLELFEIDAGFKDTSEHVLGARA